jgi:hypothetical protein
VEDASCGLGADAGQGNEVPLGVHIVEVLKPIERYAAPHASPAALIGYRLQHAVDEQGPGLPEAGRAYDRLYLVEGRTKQPSPASPSPSQVTVDTLVDGLTRLLAEDDVQRFLERIAKVAEICAAVSDFEQLINAFKDRPGRMAGRRWIGALRHALHYSPSIW